MPLPLAYLALAYIGVSGVSAFLVGEGIDRGGNGALKVAVAAGGLFYLYKKVN